MDEKDQEILLLNSRLDSQEEKINEIVEVLRTNGIKRKVDVDFIYTGEDSDTEEESEEGLDEEDEEEIVEEEEIKPSKK